MVSASLAQTVLYLNDIFLLEKPRGCILKFSHLQDGFLSACSAHTHRLLSARGIHGGGGCGSHHTRRRLRKPHLLPLDHLFFANGLLKLVFGDPHTVSAEAVIDGVVLNDRAIHREQVQPAR